MTIVTQASLSPELRGDPGTPPSVRQPERSGGTSEAALWMVATTSLALVVAAVLLLGLLSRNVVTDASLGGFVTGIGMVIAALGIGGIGYVLVTARRAGYLGEPEIVAAAASVAPAGMHVVPALPPDLGRWKRRQLEEQRSARSRQAKAIASAAAASVPTPRPVTPRRPAPRPVATARPAVRPRPQPVVSSAPTRVTGPQPARPVQSRRVAAAPPVKAPALVRASITMPKPQGRSPRPAAWPQRAPAVRMAAPPMRPRTQVATFQVNAANVRAATLARPR